MTIFTQDPGQGINQPIGNAPSGLGESLSATFEQGFEEGPFNSSLRLNRAYGQLNDPASAVVPKAQADATLKQYGVKSIIIPDEGVTQTYLDNVVENRKETLAKQQIASAAPGGFINTPLNLLSGLAGAMSDPGNLAIGLIPFAGEARAATALGRAGERFIQGAAIGGAQTAVTLPTTAMAEAAYGDDYTLGHAMETLFYGAVGGGALYAAGGAISDLFRSRRPPADSAPARDAPQTEPQEFSPVNESTVRPEIRGGDTPFLDQTIAREADNYAYGRAYEEIVPDRLSELSVMQAGLRGDIGEVRAQIAENNHQATLLDETFRDRTSQYQQQRMKSGEARARARSDIDAEKASLRQKNDELQSAIDRNAQAEQARAEQAAIGRGEIPEQLRSRVESRAAEIRNGLTKTSLAQGVRTAAQKVSAADWTIQHNAFRAGLSHMLQGKTPDVEPFFDLTAPELRTQSVERIRSGPRNEDTAASETVSRQADADYQRAIREDGDLRNAQEDFDAEIELAQSRVDELDSPELREALNNIRSEANDNSIIKGLQAYASCMLRRL